MTVVDRKRVDGTVYYVVFTWRGKRVWELSGRDKREAHRLEKRRLEEVQRGTYVPAEMRKSTTFGQFISSWAEGRSTRNAKNELERVRQFVLPRTWLTELPLSDVRPKDILRLVDELRATVSEKTKKPISAKYVSNVYGIVRTAMHAAAVLDLLHHDPCVLPRGTFKGRRGKGAKRAIYTVDEILLLTTDTRLAGDERMFNALALYTGMREGEVCGRTFADWQRDALPLGSLSIGTQYAGQPLKTEDEEGERPRMAPVHRGLARLLEWWRSEGFEFVYCRKPRLSDPIVPHRSGGHHTRSTAYKMWRRSCETVGVENRSLHSTRHTFITLSRRGGARKEVVEKVTHNAGGDIVDAYTQWDWAPLCEAVGCFPSVDASVDSTSQAHDITVEALGIEASATAETPGIRENDAEPPSRINAGNSHSSSAADADRSARQQRIPKPLAKVRAALSAEASVWDRLDLFEFSELVRGAK